MAAAKHASASTIATAPKTVMIIPQGLPELHKYTKCVERRGRGAAKPRSGKAAKRQSREAA